MPQQGLNTHRWRGPASPAWIPPRSRVRRILAGACAAILWAAPAARAKGPAARARQYYFSDIFTPFFAKDPREGVYRSRRPGAFPSRFAIRKGGDTFRVFVVGGSIAGRYAPNLREPLARALPGRRVEVLNCGMGGYDSSRDALVLKEVLTLSPDLVVIMTGHNEGVGDFPVPRRLLEMEDAQRARDEFLSLPVDPGRAPARDRTLEENLAFMLHEASRRQVAAAVVIPPINYRDAVAFPTASVSDPRFTMGWIEFLKRDFKAAQRSWSHALQARHEDPQDPATSFLHFYLGRALERLGKVAEANRHYVDAARTDPRTQRCGPGCHAVLRRTSRAAGALVVEMDEAFRRAAAPRLPGLDMFHDTVHWYAWCHPIASEAILGALEGSPALGRMLEAPRHSGAGDYGSPPQGDSGWLEEELATLRYAISDIQQFADSGPSGVLIWRAVVYLEWLLPRHRGWFSDLARTVRRVEQDSNRRGQAWGMRPLKAPLASLYWHLGEARVRGGEPAAALEDFDAALRLDPSLERVHLSRAAAQALSGDGRGASISLLKAEELLGPRHDEARALRAALGPLL